MPYHNYEYIIKYHHVLVQFLIVLLSSLFINSHVSAATLRQCTSVIPPFDVPQYTGTGTDLSNGYSTLYRGSYLDSNNPLSYYEGIGNHTGVDITHDGQMVHVNTATQVVAICDGEIVRVTQDHLYNGGWGNSVVLRHDVPGIGNVFSAYAHLDTATFPSWKIGDKVHKGDRLANIDSSGKSTGNHLHFQIDKDTLNNHPYWPIGRSANTPDSDGLVASRTYNPMQFLEDYSEPISCTTDQEVGDLGSSYGVIQIMYAQPIGQEFVPTQSEHNAIEVFINGINPTSLKVPITLSVRPVTIFGPAVATSTIIPSIESFSGGWITFDISSEPGRFLTPGQTYVIDLSTTSSRWGWSNTTANPSPYPKGRRILFGEPNNDGNLGGSDFLFRTCVN